MIKVYDFNDLYYEVETGYVYIKKGKYYCPLNYCQIEIKKVIK